MRHAQCRLGSLHADVTNEMISDAPFSSSSISSSTGKKLLIFYSSIN